MTKEQLSAWIDDELNDEESALLSRRIGRDAELREEIAGTLAIGQALRGERSVAGADFVSRIATALEDEPSYSMDASTSGANRPKRRVGWIKTAAGAGIAAAVAAVALIVAPVQQESTAPSREAFVAVPDAGQAGDQLRPDDSDYVVPTTVNDSGLIVADPELAAYFLNHSRATGATLPANGRLRIIVGSDSAETSEESETTEDQADQE
ncbi:MAG: RseA family anti-sigma factor [Pseudomonadota bacterium]